MSFQTFDSFQNQHPAPDAAANPAAAPSADTAMSGTDANAAQFQAAAQADPSGSPGNQQPDGKTTLWFVLTPSLL